MPLKSIYNKDFFIKDNTIILSDEYLSNNKKRFKKITGSRLASILDKNAYCNPLKTWMMMTNIYYEEMDETLSQTGNIIEPILKKYAEGELGINFKQHNVFQVKWDVFKENKIFGGIPDGEPINESGEISYLNNAPMLEIKTTSIDSLVYKKIDGVLRMQKDSNNIPLVKKEKGKMDDWFIDNKLSIPIEYQLQLSLYMYLRGVDNGVFAVGFLEKEDYAFPEKFDPKKRKIEFANLNLDRTYFKEIIDYATSWYEKHIFSGVSPKISNDDMKWLQPLLSN